MTTGVNSLLALVRGELRAVLATLVAGTGGSSKRLGATMWVGSSGRILGGVTIGGCVDARVLAAADDVLTTGREQVLSIALDDEQAADMGLTCGGMVRVSVELVDGAGNGAVGALAVHDLVPDLFAQGRDVVCAFALDGPGTRLLIADGAAVAGTLGDPELDRKATATAAKFAAPGHAGIETLEGAAGAREVFFERLAPAWTLVIVGASDLAVSLVRLANELGMRAIVVDGRERYATRARFPGADEVHVAMPSEVVARFANDPHAAIVIVAHDYKYELPVLRTVLRSRVGYIGMLGSRRRGGAVKQMLADEGYTERELARIHTPIGVDLGGSTSAEIALAILSEVVAVRNGKRL